jgi:transposase InsO family protein
LREGRSQEKIIFIEKERAHHRLKILLEVLNLTRSNYYKQRAKLDKDYADYQEIKTVFNAHKRAYGYRRIHDALLDMYGIIMNHKKVLRLMNKYGVKAEYVRRLSNRYHGSYLTDNIRPDHLQRNFHQRGWVTDVTYLIFGNKRAYLSTILDLETRDVVAYRISHRNDNELVNGTLNDALKTKRNPNGLVLHSDQGFQYLSNEYRQICESNGILISMSRKGTPLDNAVIESFHSILKKETLYNNNITSLDDYIGLVRNWITFYNTIRIRSSK